MGKHTIVALDDFWVSPPPDFDHEIIEYATTGPDQLVERMKPATIITTAAMKVNRAGIEAAENLQLIICTGTGSDHIDKVAARERGVPSVMFPPRTRIVLPNMPLLCTMPYGGMLLNCTMSQQLVTNGRKAMSFDGLIRLLESTPKRRKAIERVGRALGMQVLIAERKDAQQTREGRVAFAEAIRQGTILIVSAPLDNSTRRMIAGPELATMDPTARLINVGRGGVVDERALAQALKDRKIGGAATDVFETEPATATTSPLLEAGIPNLVLSPHIAWYSSKTKQGTLKTIKANLEAFVAGQPINVV
ncbi:hypothetical protein D0865_04347 [Hortaea werneckii]|uniref:D-isomer specific 2-hydroxyacid dehydrogenase NAD-binding domain-containing protein n=1 Tax=Hortaea werneckii TaxID=91943 RepID=A0A3M7CTW9_HORWE|nr:hypothetical protein D0865_04347 [Hortaea werneckii]